MISRRGFKFEFFLYMVQGKREDVMEKQEEVLAEEGQANSTLYWSFFIDHFCKTRIS